MRFQPSRLIILFLFSLACILQAVETERHSFREAYADPDTGISFPAEIGSYRKTEVVRNFNPLIGTGHPGAERHGARRLRHHASDHHGNGERDGADLQERRRHGGLQR